MILQLSIAIHMHVAGLPQGDPLSPLLFLLFIESLIRLLESHARVRGVNVRCVRICSLWYADDGSSLARSPKELQRVLRLVLEWCDAWGMQVNFGARKTEAMLFQHGLSELAATTSLPPLVAGTHGVVQWVAGYAYLGFGLRYNLDTSAALGRVASMLIDAFHRHFTRNGRVRPAPLGVQREIYMSYVTGAVNYLRSILALDPAAVKLLDTTIRTAARLLLGYRAGTSTALIWTLTRMPMPVGTNARERERLYQQFSLTSYQRAIAPRLFRALQNEPRSSATTSGPYSNWVHTTEDSRAAAAARGAVMSLPASYADIARAAAVVGRSVSWNAFQHEVHGARRSANAHFVLMPLPVPSHASKAHTIAVRDGLAARAPALGLEHGSTPLSIGGPDCSGSPLALEMDRVYAAVTAAALGAEALHDPPFAVPAPSGAATGTHDPRARYARTPCRLCNGAAVESIYHLALECKNPVLIESRTLLLASVPLLVRPLWDTASAVVHKVDRSRAPAVLAALQLTLQQQVGVQRLCTAPPDATRDDVRRLIYKLLIAVPWTCPPPADLAVAGPAYVALGRLFDALNVRHQRLREIMRLWLAWSEGNLRLLAAAWHRALLALGHPIPTASPARGVGRVRAPVGATA